MSADQTIAPHHGGGYAARHWRATAVTAALLACAALFLRTSDLPRYILEGDAVRLADVREIRFARHHKEKPAPEVSTVISLDAAGTSPAAAVVSYAPDPGTDLPPRTQKMSVSHRQLVRLVRLLNHAGIQDPPFPGAESGALGHWDIAIRLRQPGTAVGAREITAVIPAGEEVGLLPSAQQALADEFEALVPRWNR